MYKNGKFWKISARTIWKWYVYSSCYRKVLPSETFGVMGPHLGYYFSVTEHDELISDINVTENQTQDEKIVKRDNHKHRAHST